MPMIQFYSQFPNLAAKETRSITVQSRNDLPAGEYGFIELYCDEADCDCRRVIIIVTSATGPKIWATINYGWEGLQFYEKWLHSKEDAPGCKGPSLDPLNTQTEYAPTLLRLFDWILEDQAYVERLKRHYYLFKGVIQKAHRSKRQGESGSKRIRRKGK